MNVQTPSDPDMENLAQAIVTAAQKFFGDPENVRKFEEWKRMKAGN